MNTDLRNAVLAEHVSKKVEDDCFSVEFDFLCPNCGRRHWAKEESLRLFSFLSLRLECGFVCVRMPWAQTPERDELSVYGGTE